MKFGFLKDLSMSGMEPPTNKTDSVVNFTKIMIVVNYSFSQKKTKKNSLILTRDFEIDQMY